MSTYGGLVRNPALLRALGSFGCAYTAEWAFTVALGLVAFADGGAVAVGVVGMLRLLPAALLAPVVTAYADRLPRERVLVASGLVRGAATLLAAPVLWLGGPTTLVYVLAVVSTVAFTPYRASHSALVPALCRTPQELTAVNVVRGGLDSASVVLGPLVAALLVEVADVGAVFAFAGVFALLSGVLLLRLDYERVPVPRERTHLAREVRDGLVAVGSDRDLALVVGLVVLQAAVRGAFSVFVVVVTLELLERSESSVGIVQGAVGVGALVGSALCTLLVGSPRMTRWLGVAVALWGAPLAVMGVLPFYAVALLAAAVIGVGNALVDVTAFTLIARMAPDAVMARVFGVLESLGALAVGLGSLGAPLAIALFGLRGGLVAVGVVTPVVCLVLWRRLGAVDRVVAHRDEELAVLRSVPMLRPLPVPVLERLGRGLERVELARGEVLFRAGDEGDRFYVVAAGHVEVLDGERLVRRMGVGEGFGEIALLGARPRTMTVRAGQPTRLYAVASGLFLAAVSSVSGARAAAEQTRWAHLSHAPGAAADDPRPDGSGGPGSLSTP